MTPDDITNARNIITMMRTEGGGVRGFYADVADGWSAALDETERLSRLINTPRTDEFFEAVRIEAAHQIERWGVEHDSGKRSEDWVTLLIYLLGKAARAHFDGDRQKLEHHVITTAAVALNWWRHLTGVSKAMRPGISDNSRMDALDRLAHASGLNR
jgi:hypothetical protein